MRHNREALRHLGRLTVTALHLFLLSGLLFNCSAVTVEVAIRSWGLHARDAALCRKFVENELHLMKGISVEKSGPDSADCVSPPRFGDDGTEFIMIVCLKKNASSCEGTIRLYHKTAGFVAVKDTAGIESVMSLAAGLPSLIHEIEPGLHKRYAGISAKSGNSSSAQSGPTNVPDSGARPPSEAEITGFYAKVYVAPSSKSNFIAVVQRGERFPILGLRDSWYYIGVKNIQGWIEQSQCTPVKRGAPLKGEAVFLKADSLFGQGDYQNAETSYYSYLKKYPDGMNVCAALYKLGLVYRHLGVHSSAYSIWKRFLSRCPNAPQADTIKKILSDAASAPESSSDDDTVKPAAAPPADIVTNDNQARIMLFSIPPVADVYLGGKLLGRTNVDGEFTLPPGAHTLHFVKNGTSVDKEFYLVRGKNPSAMVRIDGKGQSATAGALSSDTGRLSMETSPSATRPAQASSWNSTTDNGSARLFIASIPPVADVYLDGRLMGKTNVSELNLPVGDVTLNVVKGGRSVIKRLNLRAGKNPSQMINLYETESAAEGTPEKISEEPATVERKTQRRTSFSDEPGDDCCPSNPNLVRTVLVPGGYYECSRDASGNCRKTFHAGGLRF